MVGEQKPVRVIIVDDQAIVRSGLAAFLTAFEELQLVGEAADGEEAVQLCELVHPDVVLMDVKMPIMDGITATRTIRQRWPQTAVLMLTNFNEKEVVESALEAGAAGYLLKDISASDLAEAILKLTRGEQAAQQVTNQVLIHPDFMEKMAEEIHTKAIGRSDLPGLLNRYIPKVLPKCQIKIRLFPDQDVLIYPLRQQVPVSEPVWQWLNQRPEVHAYAPGEEYPWGGRQPAGYSMVLAPVQAQTGGGLLGGICLNQSGGLEKLSELTPVIHSLSGLVARAVEKTQGQTQTLEQQKVSQELVTAGKIQASILPAHTPIVPGWDLSATLEPARETSGDFFDFIPLANGNLGLVIADVTDKGMGAALFMALSSTLLRTYATQYPTLPAFALSAVNQRILNDTHGSMFVTAFYGVLEPDTGRLRYVNAGHNPPYVVSAQRGKPVDRLRGTGMALGGMEDATWQQKIIRFAPGDVLLLYTDGITEAQNSSGQYFGEQRMLDALRSKMGCRAQEIQQALLNEVRRFTGDVPKHDDIALMVIARKG